MKSWAISLNRHWKIPYLEAAEVLNFNAAEVLNFKAGQSANQKPGLSHVTGRRSSYQVMTSSSDDVIDKFGLW